MSKFPHYNVPMEGDDGSVTVIKPLPWIQRRFPRAWLMYLIVRRRPVAYRLSINGRITGVDGPMYVSNCTIGEKHD